MIGRYGTDQLSIALLVIAILFTVVTPFVHVPWLSAISTILIIICYLRMFSKNYAKRQDENRKFLSFYQPIRIKVQNQVNRLKGSRTHKYYKCPQCHKTVRVPRGKGKIAITCPICREEFIRKS
jgi:predicted membrane protein